MDLSSGIGSSAATGRNVKESGMDLSVVGNPEHRTSESILVNSNPGFLLNPTSDNVVTAVPQPMFPATTRPPFSQQTVGYSLREKPLPNTQIDFGEIMRQQRVSEQHKLAASWSKTFKEVESETQRLRTCLYATWDPSSALELVNNLEVLWKSFESIHSRYVFGIRETKRLTEVKSRFDLLKEEMTNTVTECQKQMEIDREAERLLLDDQSSIKSDKSQRSRHSASSRASSSSSRKERLRAVLIARKKLELARTRAQEDAESARLLQEQNTKKELRQLEDETALAELDWKIETEYNEEDSLPNLDDLQISRNSKTDKQKHSTPFVLSVGDTEPRKTGPPQPSPKITSPLSSATFPTRIAPLNGHTFVEPERCATDVTRTHHASITGHQTPLPKCLQTSVQRVKPKGDNDNGSHTPKDHVAAMWKVQLLNGITPTQFSGHPADFPFFRDQVRTHLESDLLTDAQRVMYLPKFLTGEALDVLNRNRGCSYEELLKTLEERFGQPIQVTQACIEELVAGPKLDSGDTVSLLNFAEKLITATRILKGEFEHEANVATNLKRIVNRLPHDLIVKWQSVNYDIVRLGQSAKLQDVASFVKRQALIKNDPVFGTQQQKRDAKESKNHSRTTKDQNPGPSTKNATISATSVENVAEERPSSICPICKNASHRLQHCPIVKQCDRVAVRRQFAASYGFCFNCGCVKPDHTATSCPEPPSCAYCPSHHLSLLHRDVNINGRRRYPRNTKDKNTNNSTNGNVLAANTGVQAQITEPSSGNKPPTTITSAGANTTKTQVSLNIVPVIITAANGSITSTYAFLDNGCTDTLIDRELADQLCLRGAPEQLGISTITNTDQVVNSQRVSFTLSPADGYGEDIDVDEAYVLPQLNQSEQVLPESVDISKYPHLQDLKFPEVDVKRVSILVGSNVPKAHLQREVRAPAEKNNPYGYRYPLGWTIAGPLTDKRHRGTSVNFISVDHQPDDLVERFWQIEDYGTSKPGGKPLSVEDRRALQIIKDTTTLADGHYEVGLLWKCDNPQLPNNRPLADKRTESLRRRLTKQGNEELAAKYREVMNDYITKGYAHRLSPKEAAQVSPITWYLPHHPVISPNKPGKLRIVFDAAAEFEGTSLNKNLVQGPDMTNSLIGVLLRFRQGNIGLAADIQSMFHQVRVRKQDQDALRFLWWTDSYDDPPDVYVMNVHIFGAASSPCIANSALRRTADDNCDDFSPNVVEAIKRSFYVDDALPSFSDESSAASLAADLVNILDRGGFHLTKFMSNSKNVLATIPAERRAAPELNLDLDELPVERALGVRWFVESDELGFEIKQLHRPETKRGILSTICSLYDPLGFAAPVTLAARSLIQDLWKAKVDWDQPLDDHFLDRWKSWNAQLPSLSELRIPRNYFLPKTEFSKCQMQLHIFSDASEIGYGASSYLRVKYPDGTIRCSFVMGKVRNAPVKFTSIPRLELQAAVLSTRINKTLREELDLSIQSTTYWTDSEIVLHYLKNETRRFQTFVANRVEEIRENSRPEEWHHVPGTLNPADDASRGIKPAELTPDHRWLRGPEFLWQSESLWPNVRIEEIPDERLELKKETSANFVDVEVALKTSQEKPQPESPASERTLQWMINNSSDWDSLRRKVAWLIRFSCYVRDPKKVRVGHLTVEDYEAATLSIAKIIQHSAYKQEIKDLGTQLTVKSTSHIANLNPALDSDGVLRVKGRVQRPPITDAARQQIILPRQHSATTLIVRHTHKMIGHLGREHVIAKLRERFWIPQIRVLVRSVLSRCITCKKLNAKPMNQQMAPLPTSRMMAYEPPFSYTGMDLFGPLYVKHGRGTAKRWCCLFTCLNTRSAHLEMVNSMETDDFIMCLRRFLNRRGEVLELRCDRGSNFVGAERELREAINEWNAQKIERELLQRGCKWVFQPPTASSMSGIWERMVRSAKTALKAILGSQTVTDTVLQTLLTEVERMLNGRALTANSDDPNDLQPLTPAHFLMQRRTICLPPGVFERADAYHRKKWRQVQLLADLFWKRWLREYLPTLQTRGKWRKVLTNLKPNALVLLVDENSPRGRWNLGRVLETYPGPDGLVRVVKVKTKDAVYMRPIQKLCLLENDMN